MANTYFQFKHFRVDQDKSAMKVCTDACLFGAWVAMSPGIRNTVAAPAPDDLQALPADTKRPITHILDIGSGTGLLSLMLAQHTQALIDAVEIDNQAYEQTKENFERSPFSERLHAMHADIRSLENNIDGHTKSYDLIITNPPFYENDLRSPSHEINMARHDASLLLDELLDKVVEWLSPDGIFAIMLPYHRFSNLIGSASEKGLFLHSLLQVRQSPKHDFFRAMMLLKKSPALNVQVEELTIKETNHKYSLRFIDYLQDYYLSL